jgi:hypothetical protein
VPSKPLVGGARFKGRGWYFSFQYFRVTGQPLGDSPDKPLLHQLIPGNDMFTMHQFAEAFAAIGVVAWSIQLLYMRMSAKEIAKKNKAQH